MAEKRVINNIKRKLYKSIVEGKVLYNLEVWGSNQKEKFTTASPRTGYPQKKQ